MEHTIKTIDQFYAHSLPDRPEEEWEPLDKHLHLVADLASEFAEAFGGQKQAMVLGQLHDIGKCDERFLDRLRGKAARGSYKHAIVGAEYVSRFGPMGQLLAYCIAGHHAGLPDGEKLSVSLRNHKDSLEVNGSNAAAEELFSGPLPSPPGLRSIASRRNRAFAAAFYARMLFSCLVDADFLATESFMDPRRASMRSVGPATLSELLCRLDAHLVGKQKTAPDTLVNRYRRKVLDACREKAIINPGFFSMNVPTGGGKTLSSLAFALTHAVEYDLRRIVYAIPFTSIIEQTADVFREAMDDLSGEVLEHHSNLEPDDKRQPYWSKLAAENFDSPLVVTTNVQFFESLFASRTSRCRKLHRLAKSVIILDEAQTVPPNLLTPTLAALKELVTNYGTTVVLCTATQPAVEKRDGFPIGMDGVRRIIDDSGELHKAMRHRVRISRVGKLTTDQLVKRLQKEKQVLCVVNSRRHAADIFNALDDPDAVHLSANMCANHRSASLRLIRSRLREGLPCRVISTQVIEAGVDVDFPTVYRAVAGLDSIAQAIGRCNREGNLRFGRVVIFDYDEPQFVKNAAKHFREVAPNHKDDLLSPEAIEAYFRLHYWEKGGECGCGWDQGVMDCFDLDPATGLHARFRTAAERYRLIDDTQTAVLIPYGVRGREMIHELECMTAQVAQKRLRGFDRAAQRYTVGVRHSKLRELKDSGSLSEYHGRYCLEPAAYDKNLGLS